MEAEKAAKLKVEADKETAARKLGINIGSATVCMCGFENFGWEAMLGHIGRLGPPHRVRKPGDTTPWDGPVEKVYVRPKAGPNAGGCTVAEMRGAATARGIRIDLVSGATNRSKGPASPKGQVDLSDFDVGSDGKAVKKHAKEPQPPAEILDGFLYIAARRDCAAMDKLPFESFTRSVFSLNATPLATPFACEESYFVDLADQLDACLQPYFAPVCEFIDGAKAKSSRAKVVVHCQHGQSRSGALVVAYVMYSKRFNLREAISLVHSRRPELRINVAFLSQLQAFEEELGLGTMHRPSMPLEELDRMGLCKCYTSIKVPGCVCMGKVDRSKKVARPASSARTESRDSIKEISARNYNPSAQSSHKPDAEIKSMSARHYGRDEKTPQSSAPKPDAEIKNMSARYYGRDETTPVGSPKSPDGSGRASKPSSSYASKKPTSPSGWKANPAYY